ncbi:MAG: CdaR family protein [Vicinamibacterales bacterium]|nr:CdaR family protein [Vicinamibacterales bacterium]
MAAFPFRNVGLKFLSICIAGLLWLGVAGERVVERALRIPLEFQNVPASLELMGETPDSVDVRIRGSSGALARLGPGDLAALLDLGTARPGRRLFHLTVANVSAPYGVEVLQVAPSTLPIEFETSGVRVVPVRPAIEGEPAPGYEVVGVVAEPATVDVVGPESALARLTDAITEPVSVAGLAAPVREVVTVGVSDPRVRLRVPRSAQVTVSIAPIATARDVEDVPVAVMNLADGLRGRVEPAGVRVTLRGAEARLDAVGAADLELFVDAAGLVAGTYTLPVQAASLPLVGVVETTPATVRVRLARP